MNKITVIGRLTADPTSSTVKDVMCVNFTVACNTRNKDANGQTITNFYRVTAWRKLGEIAERYLKKGAKVCVIGDLLLRTYTDKNGIERNAAQITASDIEFMSKSDAAQGEHSTIKGNDSSSSTVNVDEDDLPF